MYAEDYLIFALVLNTCDVTARVPLTYMTLVKHNIFIQRAFKHKVSLLILVSAYLKSWRRKSQLFEFFDLAIVTPSFRDAGMRMQFPSLPPKRQKEEILSWMFLFLQITIDFFRHPKL